ncbi:MAG: hypothetical protein ACRECV_16965 [Xanthobacteraceae bacterium]
MAEPGSISLLKEIVQDLPIQPARAIVVFSERVLQKVVNQQPNHRPGKSEDYVAIAAFTLKFCSRYKIPVDLPASGPNVYEHMAEMVGRVNSQRAKILSGVVDSEIDSLLLDYDSGVGSTFGIARLNEEEKTKILDHLEKARHIIEGSKLSDRKKNALFERLAALIVEVNTFGTRTDRFFALAGDFVFGDMAEKAKPLLDEIKEILRIVARSRARQEGVSLPPGDEVLRLPNLSDTKEDSE